MTLDMYYANQADAKERGPQNYGGDASVAALRCFRRYHKDAHVDVVDGGGTPRWMTGKQFAIYAILQHHAATGTGMLRMADVARRTDSCVSTVSRALTKFQAWSMFGAITFRGRNGGFYVFARFVGDRLDRFAVAAKARIKAANKRIRARLVNVASLDVLERGGSGLQGRRDATFSRSEPLEAVGRPWDPRELPQEVGGLG